MKIVIIGCGKVGTKIAQQLCREGHEITVIDRSAEALARVANNEEVLCVEGSAADYAVQQEAGVPSADLVITCTFSDEVNMIACLIAKRHGAKRAIARVRDPEYYMQLPFIRDELGLSMAINPELSTASVISRILLFPAANSIEPFASGRAQMIELIVGEGNPLTGRSLIEINRQYTVKILICAIERGGEVFIPRGGDVLEKGDHLYIVSSPAQIQSFFKEIELFRSKVKNVMIAGGSRISYYLTRQLVRYGMHVKIIERDEERCRELCETLPEAEIVWGSSTSEELLDEEEIGRMDAFLALTGIDEINTMLSLYARSRGVPKVITKVDQNAFLDILDDIGVETVVSPKSVTADRILGYVRAIDASSDKNAVETLCRFVDDRLEALEFRVGRESGLIGIPLKDLTIRSEFLVACIVRSGKVIIPGGFDCLEEGDNVVIVTTLPHVQYLTEMLR